MGEASDLSYLQNEILRGVQLLQQRDTASRDQKDCDSSPFTTYVKAKRTDVVDPDPDPCTHKIPGPGSTSVRP